MATTRARRRTPVGVHARFEAVASRVPDHVAVTCNGVGLTYDELDRQATSLARRLAARGVGPGKLVAVCVERDVGMVVAALAVLKAGGGYVPLDPSEPRRRLRAILDDAAATAVVAQAATVPPLVDRDTVVLLDDGAGSTEDGGALDVEVSSADIALVVFTSGSTGRPKGVALTHGALGNLLDWLGAEYEPSLRTLGFNSFSFDASFTDVFVALTTGGSCVIVPELERRDFNALLRLVERGSVERLNLPTPVFHQLVATMPDAFVRALRSAQELWISGDRLRLSPAARAVLGAMPRCRVENHYGPTETHVCTSYTVQRVGQAPPVLDGEDPPIGSAIRNATVVLLDEDLEEVGPGEVGEVFVAGPGMARGYLGRPDLTAERFLPRPRGGPGERMYRTGDLGRQRPDGAIEFVGRSDDQVKVRGYRVELREVEAAVLTYPGIEQAAVVAQRGLDDVRLVAFVVIDRARCDTAGLRRSLRDALPHYMIPTSTVVLDQLPLDPRGKLDRSSLLDHDARGVRPPAEFVEPRSPAEQALAAIWADVLGVPEVGASDSFVDLGGHSLTAIEAAERIRAAFGRDVPLPALRSGTVRSLAALLDPQPTGVDAVDAGSARR